MLQRPLGPYSLRGVVGRGLHGVRWHAIHRPRGVPVSVEVLDATAASDPVARGGLRAEARLASLLDHPGILLVLDYGVVDVELARRSGLDEGSAYLVTEQASGGSVADLVEDGLPWHELHQLLLQLLDALAHAHARGVLHRGLHAASVLLAAEDDLRPGPKLTGFGRHLAEAPRAPESGEWRDQGPWTDLYAVGQLGWLLAAGIPAPERGDLLARSPVPPGLGGWLRWLLEPDPAQRPRSAAAAARALLRLGAAGLRGARTLDDTAGHGLVTLTGGMDDALPRSWSQPAPSVPRELAAVGPGLYWLRPPRLTGRVRERDVMWAALHQVRESGRAGAVLLEGTVGGGRSRLAEWLAQRAAELDGATVLRVSHGPRSRDTLLRLVEQHLRLGRLSRSEVRDRATAWLVAHGDPDPWEAHAITDLVRPATRREQHAGDHGVVFSTSEEPHALVRRLLEREATGSPVVLWLDDVQWGGQALDLALHLLRAQAMVPSPILVLMTARLEDLDERPGEASRLDVLRERDDVVVVPVGPLPASDHLELVRDLAPMVPELVEIVARRTAGNPLFAVQLVGGWLESGTLTYTKRGYALRSQDSVVLPDGLHAVWSARVESVLATLAPEARTALELASVLGREVDEDEWQEVTDDPSGFLRRDLTAGRFGFRPAGARLRAELVGALLEARLATETDVGWSFAHPLLRESVERMAREAGRYVAHHHAVAQILTRRLEDGQRGVAERLAKHLAASGAVEAGIDPLLRAAGERLECCGATEARTLLASARQVMRLVDLPEDDLRWARLYVVWTRVELFQGRVDSAITWSERAVRVSRSHAEALEVHALARGSAGTPAPDLLVEAREQYRAQRDLDGVVRCDLELAEIDASLRDDVLEEALAILQRLDDPVRSCDAWRTLANADADAGRLDQAAERYDRAAAFADATGYRLGQALCATGMGDVARLRRDLERAARQYTRARELLESMGSAWAAEPRLRVAMVRLEQGRPEAAWADLEPALAALRDRPQPDLVELASAVGLAVAAAQGRTLWVHDAATALERAWRRSTRSEPEVLRALELAAQWSSGHDGTRVQALLGAARERMG